MQFHLIHTEVPSLSLKKISDTPLVNTENLPQTYTLKISVFADKDNQKIFGVLFSLSLEHHQEFILEVEYLAWFENNKDLTDEDLNSSFAYINAPAIAFPYLRSFISLVTLNSGFRPAILPTTNFVKMYEDSKKRVKV